MKSFLKPKFNFLALGMMWLVAFAVLAPAILSQVGITPAKAAFNGVINYQGKLTNASNVAVADGTYNMRFKLYDTLGSGNPPTGGTLLWTETRVNADKVQVTNGVFSVMLGDVVSLAGFDFNQTLFLSVDIGGTGSPSWDGEMAPRKKIGAVPVAFLASTLKGDGVIDITSTGTQQTLNYDGSNRLTVGVASNGFTTLTSVGTGAGFNLTGGNVGIGSATASAKLHVTAATEQLRLGADVSNYTSFTTSAGGDLTIAPSGSDLAITGNVDLSGTLTSGTGNAFNVDASGNITAGNYQGTIITSVYGGTGNGFSKFTGPATSEKTFTLPNASATILTTNTAVTPAQGGTGASTYAVGDMLYSDATNSLAKLAGNTTTTRKFLRQTGNGSISAAPAWDTLTSTDVGLGNVENTALSTWAGTTNITTLGTITSGTWSGSTVQVNKGGTGTTDGSITGSGALTFTGTGGNLLLRTTTSGDVNFQPASFVANVGGGTSRTALRFLEPSGTGSDYAAIQSNANVTTSYTWTLPAADDSGCIQSNGSGALSITACGGGSQTPWASDIDAASYNLFGLSNLLFGETAAAPASSDIAIYSTGSNLILNTPSGKSLLITNDGSTEYNFSPSALNMSSNNIIGLGTAVTGTGAVTITGTSGDLSLVTATSGNVNLNSAGGTIELQDATNVTGALDVSTTLAVGTANAFQVSSAGAVTAVGVNAGAGLLQGSLGLTITGATANINASGTSATNIGNSTGALVVASGGTSSWTNTSGNLTISTATSGTLAVTSAAVLNLTSGGTSALNLDSASGTVVIATGDALQTAIAGSPGTLIDGQIWYDSTAGKYKIREGAATKILCNTTDLGCGAGGSTTWDNIGDPGVDGSINMGETTQTLDWDTLFTLDAFKLTDSGSTMTSGSLFKVTSATTGAVSNGIVQLLGSANFSGSGGLLNVTANSTTAGVVAMFSGTSLTTGTGVTITGGTAMTTGTVLASSATYNHASAETGSLESITVTDNSSASSGTTTTNGSKIAVTASSDNSGGTATVNGLRVATTIDTTGAGTKQINALNIDAPTVTACTSGACTFKGLNITGGTGSSANVTSYGAYIDAGTGSGTEYAAAFMNGNVGIGTGAPLSMLQIGAAANRGDITVYGDLKVIGADIQRTLSGIIDIFVYDTTRDSDGGEWRNSLISQQMSWATETKDDGPGDACVISSDDRCGTSVFPRKAILVTTADALYIFDGSDNSLWMKFTQAGTYALGADSNNNPSGVGAQNGVVVVGTNGSSGTGMYAIDFKQDVIYRYNTTDRRQADIGIGNRNSTATYSDNAETGFAILDNIVNDVSIAVQSTSNEGSAGTLIAPIDSQGGPLRGVTIIAAANDSGVSVINMGTRKVINYSDATNNDYNQVVMTSRGRMYATNETLAQLEEWKGVDTVSTTQANGTPTRVYDETISKTPLTTGTAPTISTNPSALAVIERASNARESAAAGQTDSGDIVFVGTNQGLAEIHTSGGTLATASWSKLTTTTVATPYMVGAAKAAFTFDEAAGATAANSVIGTAANNARLDQAGATAPTFGGGGVRGNSVNFNNNSYLCSDANDDGTCDFDSLFNSSTTSFTVSLWFKHSVTAASDTLFERCYTPATPTVAVGCIWAGMTSTGTIKIGLDSITTWTYETTYDDSVTSAATYNDNQWHHLVYTNTDTDICLYIDGRQAAACDTSLAATATLDASQVLTVGGACSGANCTTGTNFWDGSIDDMVWSSGGGTTADGLTAQSANKLYLDGRAHMIRPNATVTDATTTSSTTIGDSGESYVPDSFVGLVVELTGGTGSGQTRTIISNTATTFTVYPAFTTIPDTTTDYQVAPAKLYGSSNNVTAISVDSPTQLNKVRRVYVGTNDGADGGGVTVYTNAGAGSIKTEVIHADAGYVNDDLGSSWSGTGSDNITAIGSYSETLAIGTGAFLRVRRNDTSLKQLQGDTISAIEDIRQALVAMGLFGATQDVLGLGQGADLAEYYHSTEVLDYGDVVAIDPNSDGDDVIKTNKPYASNVLGVVSTRPGVTLGNYSESGYPIALKGRIPVKFSDENGPVKTGDYLTTSTIPGYAMRATGKGIVIGKALADSPLVENMNYCSMPNDHTPSDESPTSDSEEQGPHCGMVTMFVEQGEHSGISVEDLITQMELAISDDSLNKLPGEDSVLFENGEYKNDSTKQDKILAFLKQMREQKEAEGVSSQILTDRLSATFEVITPNLVADGLEVLTIGTEGRGINMLADLTFIGRPYFNSDTAGFAKILQGDRYVDIAFERPYLEQPTVIVNITQEQDNQILEEINQQAIDTMRVIDDANVELLFGSDIQYLVTRKNQNGFRIILSKPAPQDIIFSWVALAVKQPRLVISDGLGAGDYIPAIVEEQTIFDDNNYEDSGVVAGDNSSSSEEEALGSDDTSSTEDQSTTDDTVQPDSLNSSEGSPPSDSAAGTGLE